MARGRACHSLPDLAALADIHTAMAGACRHDRMPSLKTSCRSSRATGFGAMALFFSALPCDPESRPVFSAVCAGNIAGFDGQPVLGRTYAPYAIRTGSWRQACPWEGAAGSAHWDVSREAPPPCMPNHPSRSGRTSCTVYCLMASIRWRCPPHFPSARRWVRPACRYRTRPQSPDPTTGHSPVCRRNTELQRGKYRGLFTSIGDNA